MGTLDGEIPTSYFFIISLGFILLSYIQYKKTGKSLETIFLSIMAVLFVISYFILMFNR
tara:strand:+ start:664 stop:840 length:177 start_codon:yes stop_codon:yes gene_type:complete